MLSEMSVHELKEKLDRKDSFTLLDVRGADELRSAAINAAVHIEMNEIPTRLNELDPNHEYVVMCRSGVRSRAVTQWLMDNDFKKVSNLRGGILAWAEEVDPLLQKY